MLEIKNISYTDFSNNVMDVINVFTRAPSEITYEQYCSTLDKINSQGGHIFLAVEDSMIIGVVKVIIEQKLHNNLRCVGHIEDVATHPDHRGKGIATKLINHSIEFCKTNDCYKIVLACNDNNIDFYKNRGFIIKGVEMTMYV
jgi:glucosamine-phosphate N-acetyltransferase